MFNSKVSSIHYSLYLHIPFCQHRCAYCDFNTYAGLDEIIPDYVRALSQEAEWIAAQAQEKLNIHTIFFGGGTPSLLSYRQLESILNSVFLLFNILPDVELTLEANPGTISLPYLQNLHALGINRISLGVQSAIPHELTLLERQHDFLEVVNGVKWARQAGFENLNLDLIFGLPEQELASWMRSLNLVLGLGADHLSLYSLTIEHGTPFGHWAQRGLLSLPDPDVAADMYEWASDRLDQAGFTQYEISNWAIEAGHGKIKSCRHNLQYWRNLPYIGLGAGAHGYANGFRVANVLSPQVYIKRVLQAKSNHNKASKLEIDLPGSPAEIPVQFPISPATVDANKVDQVTEMGETMMMGLRLIQEGVSNQGFTARFGQSLQKVYGDEIQSLISKGLVEWGSASKDILRLSKAGRLLGNQVFMEFV